MKKSASTVLRFLVAVVLGTLAGSIVNMGLILVSGWFIAPPVGADVTTVEGLKASLHLFEPKHFVFPFLAHALGTFSGVFVANRLARGSRIPALAVGGIFLLGGIVNAATLSGPTWFNLLDLTLAYLPMAYLAVRVSARAKK